MYGEGFTMAPLSQPTSVPDQGTLHLPRRLFHMLAASVFPVAALLLPLSILLKALLVATALFVLGDLARLRVRRLNLLARRLLRPLLRSGEEHRVTGASYVLLGTLGAFFLFPREIAVLAVLYSAIGDPVAALVGTKAPGKRISGKSPWGTTAMIGAGVVVVAAMHITGAVQFRWSLVVGAAAAGVAELLPLPLNDNLRVPLVAGGAMLLLGA